MIQSVIGTVPLTRDGERQAENETRKRIRYNVMDFLQGSFAWERGVWEKILDGSGVIGKELSAPLLNYIQGKSSAKSKNSPSASSHAISLEEARRAPSRADTTKLYFSPKHTRCS